MASALGMHELSMEAHVALDCLPTSVTFVTACTELCSGGCFPPVELWPDGKDPCDFVQFCECDD